jgi:hypothetical protein
MGTPSSRPIRYSGPLSMFGAKVEIAPLEERLDVEVVLVPYESRASYSPKHPEVVRINPKQQVPVLVHGDLDSADRRRPGRLGQTSGLSAAPVLDWPREWASSGVGRGVYQGREA